MNLFRKNKDESFDIYKTAMAFDNNSSPARSSYLKCPEWLAPEYDKDGEYAESPDPLYDLYDPFLQRRFYKEGNVVLGVLVQANINLFKKGSDDCPADFIYSTDEYYWRNQDKLLMLADALFSTKGDNGYHPSIQKLADLLEDEYERIFSYKLPRHITEGRAVYFTTVMVQRDHLPKKKITEKKYPLLILENNHPDAMILPYVYWKK